MLITELRDVQDVLRFVEIVPVIPVREHLRVGVADPGLIDVGDDLVADSKLSEAAGLRDIFTCLLVALVTVEQTKRKVEAEGGRVVRAIAIVVGFDRWIGRAVRVGKLYVCIGNRDAEMGRMIVGPRGERLLLQVLHRAGNNGGTTSPTTSKSWRGLS